jgi:aminoglycoside phosphotransferase (APT) family kinase protein
MKSGGLAGSPLFLLSAEGIRMTGVDVTDPRPGHEFDVERLRDYLAANLDGFRAPLRVQQFRGGQSNPTFLLETGDARYVMRKKPGGVLLPSAHMIEREYQVMRALHGTDVPVIRPRLLCEDASVIGTAFYVMDFAEGRVFRDPALPGMAPAERRAIYEEMSRVMARLHAVDPSAVGLGSFGKPSGYVARQIALWTRQYQTTKTDPIPAMDALIAWLPQNIPANERTTIAHGDYRLENLMFHPTEPRVLGILDWELATLGHPLADLAYNCMIWHLQPTTVNLGGLAGRDLDALGIPQESAYLEHYRVAAGLDTVPDYPFFLAFAFFRFAAIAQGIMFRFLGGNASAPNAREVGMLTGPLAELGWRAAQTR